MSAPARTAYLVMLTLSALFETYFAVIVFISPDKLVAADNERALWFLQAYAVAILALSLISLMGWALRHDRRVSVWIAGILTFFHSIQFSGVLAKDWPQIIVSPGWAHGLVALLAILFLMTQARAKAT